MGRGEGQADRNLGHHRAGGGGRLLDAYRALTAREQRPAIIRRRRPVAPPFSYCNVRSLFLTSRERRANNSRAAGQGLRNHIAAANAAVSFSLALWPRGRMRWGEFSRRDV